MLRQIVLLLISSFLFPQSVTSNQSNQPIPYGDADAYEVYSVILPSEWPMSVARAQTLVIHAETKAYKMCLRPEKDWEEMIGPAISDYEKVNQKTWAIKQKFDLKIPYKIVNSDELKAAMADGGWDGFYKHYPKSGGWIELSAVGFDVDRSIAVVYMGHSCGDLCGGGTFHVLQKKDGKWAPLAWKGRSCSWAS